MKPRTLSRLLILVATTATPLVGGAVIYYSLRKTHPRTAQFANLLSVAGFAWSTVWFLDWPYENRWIGVIAAIGVVATELAIRVTRRMEEEEPELDTRRTSRDPDRV